MSENQIVINSRVYIPIEKLNNIQIMELQKIYNISSWGQCFGCVEQKRRSTKNKICMQCEQFYTCRNYLMRRVNVKDKQYWSFPSGNTEFLEKYVDLKSAIDMRKEMPFNNNLIFTGKLRTGNEILAGGVEAVDQKALVDQYLTGKDAYLCDNTLYLSTTILNCNYPIKDFHGKKYYLIPIQDLNSLGIEYEL